MQAHFDVLIEIPKGTKNNKFERDPKTGQIVLDFVFENLVWPFNYGEIINTKGGDGDALDAIVFSSEPLEQGSVVVCAPFGVMLSLDRGEQDDKILMVPIADDLSKKLQDMGDFSLSRQKELIDLYQNIAVQKKKTIEILGFKNKQLALGLIENSFEQKANK